MHNISNTVLNILEALRRPREGEKGRVFLPKFFAILGSIFFVACLIPAIITFLLDQPLWIPILFAALSLPGASLLLAFINCRITYDDDSFTAGSIFGIKREFTYDQVTAIRENTHESYIYVGKRRILVDEFSIGGKDFIKQVKIRYSATHSRKMLPRKQKRDLFNGNIREAEHALLAYIIVALMLIGLLIFIVVYVYGMPDTENNTIKQTVSFASISEEKDKIILMTTDGQKQVIRFVDEAFHSEDIRAICDGKTLVTTYCVKVVPDVGEAYYAVKAIAHGDAYLLSFTETKRLHIEEYKPLIAFGGGMCVAWVAYVVASVIVGRNIQKFPKWIARFFFNKKYIKY